MIHLNASNFQVTHLNPHCVVYSASAKDIIPYQSFEEAHKLITWRGLFYPFAQVIVNTITGEFILARDHLGVRPLYYCYQDGTLIFGDTIPDILRYLPQPPALLEVEIIALLADAPQYTDKTIHQGIYRVEPGHLICGKPYERIIKSVFWQLEPNGEELYYRDEREYLEHFTVLMGESIRDATCNANSIAAEFSAGMDSTAIYCASRQQGLNPQLFMHAAIPGSASAKIYNQQYENTFSQHFPLATIQRILDDDFDALKVFKNYASWFGGPAPYLFELFANNIHQAVAASKHSLLLSGFGGDQGVSGHIPTRFLLPSLIKDKQYHQAWLASATHSANTSRLEFMRRSLLLIQSANPLLNQCIHSIRDLKLMIYNLGKPFNQKLFPTQHPYYKQYFQTVREAEWSFLQGPNSHEIRLRIEYSSIVAKKMGFEYRYPLLHPKLLEFFLSLPVSQKRQYGKGRYLMRRYLAQHIPNREFDNYNKKEGLSILPATLASFKSQWLAGKFQDELGALPYKQLSQDISLHKIMIKTIQAFMLKEYAKI